MTNISKNNTSTTDYKLAYQQLVIVISKLEKNNASFFIDELFTDSEKIMIVKRFAAIFMFQQNYTAYRVSHLLAMSLSTTHRLYKLFESGHFDKVLSCISKKQESEFFSLLEDFIFSKASGRARSRLLKRTM
jgi:uncharacterized protein YerC